MSPIEETIMTLLSLQPPGKSLDPAVVAQAVDAEGWRRALPQVRSTAVGLARQGKLVILRHNKPADPDTFKGVWRMRLPLDTDVAAPDSPPG
jgi:hypothetical protein